MFLSVVITFYNEEEVLPELIRRLRAVLQPRYGREYEIIFVDDNSTDRSPGILESEARAGGDIKVITMSRNFGISVCALAGMEHATGDAVVYMDADLQDPPELIPELVAAWQKDPEVEVVHTVRSRRSGESRLKLLITKVGYRILRAVSTIDLIMDAGDFKLLSRRAVNELLRLREQKPFLRGMVIWIGFKQARVAYARGPRFGGKSKCPVYSPKVVNYFLDTALLAFSQAPLRLALFLGLFVFLSGVIYPGAAILAKAAGWSCRTWSPLVTVVLLLGGAQLFAVGLIGLSLNVVFLEVKRRPRYVIKRTIGFDRAPAGDAGARQELSPPRGED